MFYKLKRAIKAQKNRLCLERWTARTDGDATWKFYVERRYEANLSYYDLYWHIRRADSRKCLETIYIRAEELRVADVIHDIEANELPGVIQSLCSAAGHGENPT